MPGEFVITNQEIVMTVMTIEEMTRQKKNLLFIHWSSFAGMAITFAVWLFQAEVLKGVDPRVSVIALVLAFAFYFCSRFHSRKARKLEAEIENQQVIKRVFASLVNGKDSFFGALYDLECKGYKVLEVLKDHPNPEYILGYKEYVKGKYLEKKACFKMKNSLFQTGRSMMPPVNAGGAMHSPSTHTSSSSQHSSHAPLQNQGCFESRKADG